MIYLKNLAKMPRAEAVDYSSGTAELPDNEFMDQFETVDPQELLYQPDLDNLVYGNYKPDLNLSTDETFPQEDLFYPQDPIYGVASHADNQYTPSLEQAPSPPNQFQDRQEPHSGVGLNEDSLSDSSLNQQFQNLQDSLQYVEGFEDIFGFRPDPQSTEWDQSLDMASQLQNTPIVWTARFSLKTDPVDEFTNLGHTDNGPVYQFEESPGELVTPGPASNGPVYQSPHPQGELANPAPTWNGSVHQSPSPQAEFANSAHTWNYPSPGIEQLPVVQENVPQASRLSIHTPPNDQHLSADTEIPPAPRKEKKRPKVPLNKRKANIESIDTSKYYQRLPNTPRSWNPPNDNGMLTFQYNEYGELSTNKFSPDQIEQYLYNHPLNYDRNGFFLGKNSRLTLWIQVTPADAGRRYPSASSDKCRFADCPIPHNTIRKGFFRVAFDEHGASGRQIDPYHCAGFVHLFCLEKFCDFPSICQILDVQPDRRNLPEGKNKMAITRDHEEMFEVVRTFIQSAQKPMPWDYEQTLSFRLTSKHLELEPKVRDTTREIRGGNHIALHKGDLDKFMEGENHKVAQRRAAPPAQKPKTSKRKRDIAEEEEDIANLEDEVKHQQSPIKRTMRRYR